MSWPYDVELLTIEPLAVPTGGTEPSVPACKVFITPQGRAPFPALLQVEPTYSEQRSGPTTAKISCVVPDYARDRLLDADVVIHPPAGERWVGYVADVDDSAGVVMLTCLGAQHLLSRVLPGPLPYCDTSLDFDELNGTNWGAFQRSISVATIDMGQSPNTTASIGDLAGYFRYFGFALDKVTCSYEVNHADVRLDVFGCDAAGAPTAAISSKTIGTGTVSLDLDGASGFGIRAYVVNEPSTPARYDKWVKITDLKLYGVDGVATSTVSTVLADLASRIPAWTGISQTTQYLEADTTVVEPLVFDADSTLLDCIDEVRKFTTNGVSIRSRMVGGEYVPCLVSESYGAVEYVTSKRAELKGAGVSSLADSARVFYTDPSGRSRYIDVTDSSEDGYLQTIGTKRAITLGVPTSSTAVATAHAQDVLASMRQQLPAGTHTVSSYVKDVRGADVLPSEIHAGRYFRFLDTPLGAVDVLVTEVTHIGGMEAWVGLSGAPLRLDTQLALMGKRQR